MNPQDNGRKAARVSRIAATVFSTLMTASAVVGQSSTNAIPPRQKGNDKARPSVTVTVVDPTNAVIQKARVQLSPGKDAVAIGASSDSRGVVRYRGLSRGTYQIMVHAPGFRTAQQTVTIKNTANVRFKLQIAVKPETVEVTTAPGVVDTFVNVALEPLPYVPYVPIPFNQIRLAVI